MKRMAVLLAAVALLLAGCSSGSSNVPTETSQLPQIFNVSTSHFDHYTSEQLATAYAVTGTVSQENDGNAVLAHIHAEKDVAVGVTGTLRRISGADTQLVYIAPDGTETEIADSSIETLDSTVHLLAGDGTVKFIGESAVYDFEIEFELMDGVSYQE